MRLKVKDKNLIGYTCFQESRIDILIPPAKYTQKPWTIYIKQSQGDSERWREGGRLARHANT